MQNDLYKRLAQVESMVEYLKGEMEDSLIKNYEIACANKNEEDAAEFARKIRNFKLMKTDKEMTFDRIPLDLKNPLNLITSLKEIANGKWAIYRQALRDLPTQEGFPFNVKFPEPPFSEDEHKEMFK